MSLFLVYFEIGKNAAPPAPPAPLCSRPCELTVDLPTPRRLNAILLTDGHSSERLLVYNNKVVGRQGEVLRAALYQYLRERVIAGARPHLAFVTMTGAVDSVSIRLENKRSLTPTELEKGFAGLKPLQVIEVKPEPIPEEIASDPNVILSAPARPRTPFRR